MRKIFGFCALFAGFTLCGCGLWILLNLGPAQYLATCRIEIMLDITDSPGLNWTFRTNDPAAEIQEIQSLPVLGSVVSALNLNVDWGNRYHHGVPFETSQTIQLLKRRLNVLTTHNTYLIKITVQSEVPDEAARLANAIAHAYADYFRTIEQRLAEKKVYAGHVAIVDRAMTPETPIRPNRLLGSALMLCGLGLSNLGFHWFPIGRWAIKGRP